VAFEPNIWIRALSSFQPSVHWASSTDPLDVCDDQTTFCNGAPVAKCFNRRGTSIDSTFFGAAAPGLLESSSISRWVRDTEGDELPTPCFIAAGDGLVTTGFARNANLPPALGDYDRHMTPPAVGCGSVISANTALIPGDPVLEFTAFPDQLNLHDSWNAVNLKIDLLDVDATLGNTFNAVRSRLYLQDGDAWGNLPPCLSTTAFPPTSSAEVSVLDGTFANEGNIESIGNGDLAPKIVTWMEAVLGIQRGIGLVSRNPALVGPCDMMGVGTKVNPNLDIYTASTANDGLPIPVEVDLNGVPDYDEAAILVFTASADPCDSFLLSGGQAVLCDFGTLNLSFGTSFKAADPDGIVRLTLGPATGPGTFFCTQAILRDTEMFFPPMGTKKVFALTNAVDITVQDVP